MSRFDPTRRSFLLVAALAFAIACSGNPEPTEPPSEAPTTEVAKKLDLGVLVPLTGGAASYGQNSKRGVELAVSDFKEAHPDWTVEVAFEDSAGAAATGTRAVQKLIDADGIDVLIGGVTSGVTMAVKPIVDEREIPPVSMGASSPNLATSDFIFRTWPSDTLEATAMARHMTSYDVGKLALLRINNEYGLAMEDAFKAALAAEGGTVTVELSDSFEQGAREMRTQAERIKQSGATAIYFIGFPEAAIVFGRAYAEAGLKLPVFATSAFEDPKIPEAIGSALDGTVYTKPGFGSPRAEAFGAAYEAAHGEKPGLTSDTAYDAAMVALEAAAALQAEGTAPSGPALRDRIGATDGLSGVSGTITFDANGDVQSEVGYHVLEGGEYKEWSP